MLNARSRGNSFNSVGSHHSSRSTRSPKKKSTKQPASSPRSHGPRLPTRLFSSKKKAFSLAKSTEQLKHLKTKTHGALVSVLGVARELFPKPAKDASEFLIQRKDLILGEVIGVGGSNKKVYKAKFLGSDVAVKELDDNDTKEFEHLRVLKHPNVVQLYGIVQDKETSLLVEELGVTSLEALLKKGDTQVDRFQLAMQICAGCAYIHDRDIVHCDIKVS